MTERERWSTDPRGIVCFAERSSKYVPCPHGKGKLVSEVVYTPAAVEKILLAPMPPVPIGDGLFVLMLDLFGELQWCRMTKCVLGAGPSGGWAF